MVRKEVRSTCGATHVCGGSFALRQVKQHEPSAAAESRGRASGSSGLEAGVVDGRERLGGHALKDSREQDLSSSHAAGAGGVVGAGVARLGVNGAGDAAGR